MELMGIFKKSKSKKMNMITKSQVVDLNPNVMTWEDVFGAKKRDAKALSEVTYFTCLKTLSEAIGKLPCRLLKYTDGSGVKVMRGHELYRTVYIRPNPYMTATAFWAAMEYNCQHYGNAYALITGAGKKTELWILPPQSVRIVCDNKNIFGTGQQLFYRYTANGQDYIFHNEEIIHIRTCNTFDGISGKSVREQLFTTIEGNLKAQAMLNKMYDSSFSAKAIVEYTGDLNEDSTQKYLSNLSTYVRGDLKGKGIEDLIPVPVGNKITPFSAKLGDNEFLGIKKYSSLQIAAAFGIKPYQIGNYEQASYKSSEAQQLAFYIDTLLPRISQYEQELSYKLLSDKEIADGLYFNFHVDVILRADFSTKVDTLVKGAGGAIYTVDEARGYIDLGNVPGGDRVLGNGNLIPIELAGLQYIKQENQGKEENDE